MLTIDPKSTPTPQLHQYLLGSVSPRPIAFVSTISPEGVPNLAPYSFFNVFSSNPPTAIFSSNRTVANNTTKDTLANAKATGEVVINVVSHEIVRQMSLASISYPAEVDEFAKAGLTPIASDLVKPFRVKESPSQMECRVKEIIPLGDQGGAGNLIICDILRIHIREDVLDEEGRIDPHKMDLMGRMGRAFYCRASGSAVSRIFQPVNKMGMGFEGLPEGIRYSKTLTGNQLAELAAFTELPLADGSVLKDKKVQQAMLATESQKESLLHQYAASLIDKGEVEKAWQVLLV
jgi:flavin reductase (DIM6/NTAB) family NADH-FMN oxidoreductase RutF